MDLNPSWKNKFQESFRDLTSLSDFLGWENPEAVEKIYPVFVPRDLAEKMKVQGPSGVLAREFYPVGEELIDQGYLDPIGDRRFNVAPQLIHRYPNRVLFTATSVCPVHCRYCFRKNELSPTDEIFERDFEKTLSYLWSHPEISEIIFTGGDPLTLSDEKLNNYLEAFAKIPHIRDVRFHSRYPVILPERIDEGFLSLLSQWSQQFRTLSLAVHANHVDEFSPEAMIRIRKLSEIPVQLLSQTVLLRGVNDTSTALVELMNLFLELRVRPYYLHHPDQVRGGMHFYLPLEEGRRIYGELRRHLPGWAIPQYVIDVPGGAGKIPAFNPEAHAYSGSLLTLNGEHFLVAEPGTRA